MPSYKRPRRPREGEVLLYSFLNLVAQWGRGAQRQAPAALPPGKIPGTNYTGGRVGLQAQSERVRKTSLPPVFDPPVVQPVAMRYTFYVNPIHYVGQTEM